MEKLAPSQDVMALPQAEKVGLSLVSQPHLLLSCPLMSPPGYSCCTTTKTSQAVKEAPCLTSDPFDAFILILDLLLKLPDNIHQLPH